MTGEEKTNLQKRMDENMTAQLAGVLAREALIHERKISNPLGVREGVIALRLRDVLNKKHNKVAWWVPLFCVLILAVSPAVVAVEEVTPVITSLPTPEVTTVREPLGGAVPSGPIKVQIVAVPAPVVSKESGWVRWGRRGMRVTLIALDTFTKVTVAIRAIRGGGF